METNITLPQLAKEYGRTAGNGTGSFDLANVAMDGLLAGYRCKESERHKKVMMFA